MTGSHVIHLGDWEVRPHQNRLIRGEEERRLDHKHMCVLIQLAAHPDRTLSREDLLATVWEGRHVSHDVLAVAISHIRKALGDDARKPRYIKTVPGKGYCLIAHVSVPPRDARVPSPDPIPEKTDPLETPPNATGRTRRTVLATGILLSLGLAAIWLWRPHSASTDPTALTTTETQPSKGRLVAVLPLAFPADADLDHVARGLVDQLTAELAVVPGLRVISRGSVAQQEGRDTSPLARGRELGADLVLEGSLHTEEEAISLSLNLHEVARGRNLWSHTQSIGPVHATQPASTAATGIAAALGLTAPSREDSVPPEALDAYWSGCYWLAMERREDWHEAAVRFQRAVDLAPRFARAYLGLVKVRLRLQDAFSPNAPEADELDAMLHKALALNPNLAEAHLLRADLSFLRDWRFAEAETHFRRALDLAPGMAEVHFSYAQFLLAQGKTDEALSHVARLRELDPLSYSRPVVAWIHNMARDYERALDELQRLRPAPIPPLMFHDSAMKIYDNMGREHDAYRHMRAIMELRAFTAEELAAFDRAFAEGGGSAVYRRLLDTGEYRHLGHYRPPLAFARYSLSIGDLEGAFHWLGQAVNMRQVEVLWVSVDPKYEPLRKDPRYRELIERINPLTDRSN
ncbi:Winged helix-turn-helix domain-containing protein [Sulfidibacter corallicola]|uniref:Winged helix-turn-helix domain-containing protein n=1 Tax=Sulfidibacter corallicola TaxID=2818388 RepID=A0A8A4TZL5_SULCO|nr:winged helix-turn-helix domain-containing protein [Sulfidibacter corallicola]QTD51945.1 winged helix-turn-helix domain-containing protein [Sulfidibacter corallicola]